VVLIGWRHTPDAGVQSDSVVLAAHPAQLGVEHAWIADAGQVRPFAFEVTKEALHVRLIGRRRRPPVMLGDGQQRRQLTPEQKWEVFLEVTSQELTQADAARKWQVDVSTVIKIRRLARDAALAAFAASKPGRPRSPFEAELAAERAENARLSEALKELAVELTLVRGKSRSV
jgi:transposase